jgi:hypothetical protein
VTLASVGLDVFEAFDIASDYSLEVTFNRKVGVHFIADSFLFGLGEVFNALGWINLGGF